MKHESWRGSEQWPGHDDGANPGSPYYEQRKYPEPTICSGCGLVYHKGHWANHRTAPEKANHEKCPACKRIAEHNPGGIVFLRGSYMQAHGQEILNVAHNQEKMAKEHRPLQRIMWTRNGSNALEIAVTNFHLARRIGEAIHHAHKGELEVKYSEGDRFARVYWSREA
jgi:hypothetical protein